MGIKTVPRSPYSRHLTPCDFWLFPKLRGCRYETIEEMKEAVTKAIDTLTQEDFHGVFQKLLERYECITARGEYFEGDWGFMCVLSIKVPIRKKSGNLFNDPLKKILSSMYSIFIMLHPILQVEAALSQMVVGIRQIIASLGFGSVYFGHPMVTWESQILVIFSSLFFEQLKCTFFKSLFFAQVRFVSSPIYERCLSTRHWNIKPKIPVRFLRFFLTLS